MLMKITSWNINSVRIRLDLIKRYIEHAAPDILCLQETKTQDDTFPHDALQQMGFAHCYFKGQKSYNGMAICSKVPLSAPHHQRFLPNEEERHMAATLPCGTQLHNLYVPAGGDIADPVANPKFKDKLAFMDALIDWSRDQKDAPRIILGDMNIAPLEHDVWSHKQLLKIVSHTPIEIEKMTALQDSLGWVDALREFVPPSEKLYSWWSYRAKDYLASNRGRRLDHIWLTPNLKSRLIAGDIFTQARGWEKPSDHVPVSIEISS
jgi:exodeoxyribonuclease-3